MNPDTKLTLTQIKAICAKHGITYKSHQRITTGFSHEVHRLNDDLIIKIFNKYDEHDERRFKTEAGVLASRLSFKKPKLIASCAQSPDIDRSYIIMSFVPGKSLGSYWHLATDTQREALIKDICQSLKVINHIKPSDVALVEVESWEASIKHRGESLVAKLKDKNIIDTPTAKKLLHTIHKTVGIFAGTKLYPVYWDIHFDNFIVNDNFELQAIIDLENVELTALDYPLFVIQKQTDEPEKFLREEDEKYADKKDYKNLKGWYQKYYPELFAFDNLDARLRMYQLLDVLHLLIDWSHVKGLHERLKELGL